jgi:octaprenyl-diphosphate synthase
MDDVLDYRSNPSARGKNLGDDLAEGKPTLPLIHALRHGDESQRSAIRRAIKDGGLTELGSVVTAIETTGGLEYAQRAAESESELALAALDVLPDSSYKEGLASLARFAVEHTT